MSPKPKRGLQGRGLPGIVERQTAPIAHREQDSKKLLNRFKGADSEAPATPSISPATQTSQVVSLPHDEPETSQVAQTSQAPQTDQVVNLLASLPNIKGHTQFPHQCVDHLYPMLDAYEQATHLHLYRLSHGHHKDTCTISLAKLAYRAGVSLKTCQRAVAKLVARGLVARQDRVIGYGKEQGSTFWVAPMPSQATETRQVLQTSQVTEAYIKDKDLKETHTNTEGVRVGSRFSLKECRQYADSLKSEGIQNPGGYATKIHRTGEADELIERFLSPPAPAPAVNASQCPDCSGSGWWYPKGPGKGIARCKHERVGI